MAVIGSIVAATIDFYGEQTLNRWCVLIAHNRTWSRLALIGRCRIRRRRTPKFHRSCAYWAPRAPTCPRKQKSMTRTVPTILAGGAGTSSTLGEDDIVRTDHVYQRI